MARLMGITLPDDKRIDYSLTILYGIGWGNVGQVLTQANVSPSKRVKELTEDELKKITEVVEKNYKVEGDLREVLTENIKRLKEIGSYRGSRHMKGLPSRGQRTKSNARTKRGKRKTVGALRKEAWAKLESGKTADAVKEKTK
ncbi:MAG: 30S ribosomal protein S13 [Candidatus Roizmanbacteria bacterium GW2011_GWA2_35_19]|uniref:Small ribosomal subunit protein uS13 n=2 Tax=Candidatus Roizmaniibacteriota TaxID=1752723 RepID=A0A0G0EXX0_9BACT|nr:MAG: 30S ribosomal protein S13 [Candidatus Roizmanbacteria bacterium GW2011_GWC2_35_12]KKP72037.1 MAG: 30S ribosomal protein S13 [Candidatus Roizmanbacteria bacterium GW2011_GWA2_35_19]